MGLGLSGQISLTLGLREQGSGLVLSFPEDVGVLVQKDASPATSFSLLGLHRRATLIEPRNIIFTFFSPSSSPPNCVPYDPAIPFFFFF